MEKRPQNTGENSQEEDTYLEQIQRNLARLDQDKKKAKEAIANIVKKDRESKETLLSSESKTKEIKISHEDPRGIDLEKSSDKTGELKYARNREKLINEDKLSDTGVVEHTNPVSIGSVLMARARGEEGGFLDYIVEEDGRNLKVAPKLLRTKSGYKRAITLGFLFGLSLVVILIIAIIIKAIIS